jgi:hypothetical protein
MRAALEDHTLVVLKAFFDGGNQADSRLYDVVSLASISGTPAQWRAAERDWKQVLKEHRADWLHTTDALTLNEPFTKDNGWSKEKINAFISACVDVIERHVCVPNIEDRTVPRREGLIPLVVSVVLADYVQARTVNADVPNTATELCAAQSVGMLLARGKAQGAHFYHLTFDQGEPFMGHVQDRRNNKKARYHLKPIADGIVSITEANMRVVPALQMADVFAWSYSHKKTIANDWQQTLLEHAKWVDDWYDYKAIAKVIPGVADLVRSWKLPPRKPTR